MVSNWPLHLLQDLSLLQKRQDFVDSAAACKLDMPRFQLSIGTSPAQQSKHGLVFYLRWHLRRRRRLR